MAKTKEELQELKKEFVEITNKLKSLGDDELRQIVGARDDHTILPDDDFWHNFNPFFPFLNKDFNDLGLLKDKSQGSPSIENVEFNGSISNREDNN